MRRVCQHPWKVSVAVDRVRLNARKDSATICCHHLSSKRSLIVSELTHPLTCTHGRPSLAALSLLRALHSARVEVLLSADHDRGGQLVKEAVRSACPDAHDWLATERGVYEEERLTAMLRDLARVTPL